MNSCAKSFILIAAVGVTTITYLATILNSITEDHECGNRRERPSTKVASDSFGGYGRSYRLVGGVAVNASTWPWQVSIMHREDLSSPYLLICGGSIVHQDWILTAAACVHHVAEDRLANLIIKAGSVDIYNNDENTQELHIERIVTHGSYNPITQRNNIALMKLNTSLVFNQFVDQICIPNKDDVQHKYGVCHITGYGEKPEDNGTLQEAEVELISNTRCNMPTWHYYKVAKDMFCAGGFQGGPDGCEGNTGGPLSCYLPAADKYYVSGIRVHTKDCGIPRRPNIYLKVSQHFYWIERELKKYDTLDRIHYLFSF